MHLDGWLSHVIRHNRAGPGFGASRPRSPDSLVARRARTRWTLSEFCKTGERGAR